MGMTLASPWTLWSPQSLSSSLGDDHSDDDAICEPHKQAR